MKKFLRLGLVAVSLLCIGCSGERSEDGTLVLYSGRSQSLVEPIIRAFESQTGVAINVKYGSSAQLVIALQEEGAKSPADVFWAQDAGALGVLSKAGLLAKLSIGIVDAVPEKFCDRGGEWVATSGRARLFAYAPSRVGDLPTSVFDLTDPVWEGRVGWAPLNASFQSFVTAMRVVYGSERTEAWLLAMKNNGTKSYPKNTPIIEAIAAGEIDVGLPNHYYLLRFKKTDADYPVEQDFFEARDIGNLVNVAGIGVIRSTSNKPRAEEFIRYLLSREAQRAFVEDIFEYPVVDVPFENPSLVDMERLMELAPPVELNDLDSLNETLDLLRKVGLL